MAQNQTIVWHGLAEMELTLQKVQATVMSTNARVVNKAMYKAYKQSQELVPVDTGRLKASAEYVKAEPNTDIISTITYTTEYATYVHERLDVHHPHGQAKFLEQPINEVTRELQLEMVFANEELFKH